MFHIHFISVDAVGIVKISEAMHENLRVASDALNRSINAQAEHWMRIGMLTQLHPSLDYNEIYRFLIRAELAGGLDLAALCALADAPSNQATAGAKS